jgi:hypothetical protein
VKDMGFDGGVGFDGGFSWIWWVVIIIIFISCFCKDGFI